MGANCSQERQLHAEHQRSQSQAELAENDLQRAKRLIASKVISGEDSDTKAKTHSAAVAAVKSAKARMDSAKLNLEFTEIRAPINGRISSALVTEGNLISGGAGAGSAVLTTLVSLDPLYCYGDADELAILKYIQLSREGKRDSARDGPIPAEMQLANESGLGFCR